MRLQSSIQEPVAHLCICVGRRIIEPQLGVIQMRHDPLDGELSLVSAKSDKPSLDLQPRRPPEKIANEDPGLTCGERVDAQ